MFFKLVGKCTIARLAIIGGCNYFFVFIPTSLDVRFLEKHRNLQCYFGFVFHGFACIKFIYYYKQGEESFKDSMVVVATKVS